MTDAWTTALKKESNWRNLTGTIERNGMENVHTALFLVPLILLKKLMFDGSKNTNRSAAILCLTVICISDIKICWRMLTLAYAVWKKYQIFHKTAFLCYSLVKSDQTRLHPKELKLGTKGCFFCLNIDKTTKRSMHMEIVAHFLHFLTNLCLWFDPPSHSFWDKKSAFQFLQCPKRVSISTRPKSQKPFCTWPCLHD